MSEQLPKHLLRHATVYQQQLLCVVFNHKPTNVALAALHTANVFFTSTDVIRAAAAAVRLRIHPDAKVATQAAHPSMHGVLTAAATYALVTRQATTNVLCTCADPMLLEYLRGFTFLSLSVCLSFQSVKGS